MSKKATIYDVAKNAKVSLATVSRVINNSSLVKESTRNKVLSSIEKLNFVPNEIAQNLALSKTAMIALIVPDADFSYIGKVISGVIDIGHHYNYNVVMYSTKYGDYDIDNIIKRIIKARLDGVIILNTEITTKTMDLLKKNDIPICVVGTLVKGKKRSSVRIDYENVVYNIVKNYLERDLTKIVFIDGEYNRFIVEEMLFGIKKAYNEYNIDFNGYVKVSESYQESYLQLKSFLKHNKVDLCIGARDSLAIAALNAAVDLGLNVPNDIEVIGFNNTKYARMARPSLSSVHVPLYEMGSTAAKMMTKMLQLEVLEQTNIVLDTELINRDSTK